MAKDRSPDGTKLLYASTVEGSVQLWLRWMDTGQTAKLTNLTRSPEGIYWSPDGRWIAFTMFVPDSAEPMTQVPAPPPGAQWAAPARVITQMNYRADGAGYLEPGHFQIFLLSADGGTPRQLTSGVFDHGGELSWTPDSGHILFTANRHEDAEFEPLNSEIYTLSIADGEITALTDRYGPDGGAEVSPDGERIAYVGFDDRHQGYQITRLYVMNRDGSGSRLLTGDLDRDVNGFYWKGDGSGLYIHYDDEGNTKIASVSLRGRLNDITGDVGGLSIGRPYSGGQFSVSRNGRIAFTYGRPDHPADLAVVEEGREGLRRLTRLNDDLFGHKQLGEVEEIWYNSSFDNRPIQGWILKPPDFDPQKKYPLILEIHGGPFANYGDRFSAEDQLYAAADYVVLYTNPRGTGVFWCSRVFRVHSLCLASALAPNNIS